MPKRIRYRKQQRGTSRGVAQSGNAVSFGDYGLQALERAWVTNIQIEACRVAINRSMKRKGKMWIRIFPDKPITKKPLETRMGKGKANVDGWVAVVRPGHTLFEVSGVPEMVAREALRLAATKMPIRTRVVQRHHHG
jgi:large subunit ribosomal protein L16